MLKPDLSVIVWNVMLGMPSPDILSFFTQHDDWADKVFHRMVMLADEQANVLGDSLPMFISAGEMTTLTKCDMLLHFP